MKAKLLFVAIIFCACKAQAQSIDPVSLVIAKVVKALDLQVQKLQIQTLSLQQLQLVAEHELSKSKLAEIADWQEKQQSLYDSYFKELKAVKSSVKSLAQARQVISMQTEIMQTYKKLTNALPKKDRLFRLSHEILQSLDTLMNSGKASMGDADRIMTLIGLRDAMERCLEQMLAINEGQQQTAADSLQRQSDFQLLKRLNKKS